MDLIEHVQYKVAFIVSGCWQGTSRENYTRNLVMSQCPTEDGFVA